AEQTHRDDQNDRERQQPALIKCRQQQKNKQNAKRKNVGCTVAGEFLLQRDLRPLRREACRQNLFRETFDGCQRITSAGAWCGLAAEIGRRKHVVTRDLVRTAHFLYGRDGTERNNSARIIARLEQTNVVGAQAKLRIGLSRDAISSAKECEIVDVCRSKVSLERAENV